MAARTRILSALAVAGLVAMAVLGVCGSAVRAQPAASSVSPPQGHGGGGPADRIILIAIALVAAGTFAILQVIARAQRRRWSAFADWRTWPPGHDPWADRGDPIAGRHEGSAYRPGYGFLPGHGQTVPPPRSAVPSPRSAMPPRTRSAVLSPPRSAVPPYGTPGAAPWMRERARLRCLCQEVPNTPKGES
jgi:hypothetical protein